MTNALKDKLDALKVTIQTQREEIKKTQIGLFDEVKKAIFEENPKLTSFGFSGWVPYFNDGDTCSFSAHIDSYCVEINGKSYDDDYDRKDDNGDLFEISKSERKDLAKIVSDALNSFEEDFYEEMFGSHFKVHITPTETSVEEYTDHD